MTFTILHKRSNVASHVPNTTQLALGEVAVNTYDGLLYFVRQQNTTNTVETISPLPPSITLAGDVTGSANFSGANAITLTTSVLTAITQPVGDSTTNVATTAFVAGAYLPVSGGTMTGDFTVANAAANANAGVTRFHVDATTNGVVTGRVSLVANPAGGSAIDIFGPAPAGIQSFSNLNANSQIWLVEMNTGAATGNNIGDNYTITAYDDIGVPMPITAQTIYRSNSVTVFGNTIVTVTQPAGDNTTNVATTAFVTSALGSGPFLPLSGGTMTGPITMGGSGTYPVIMTTNSASYLPVAVQSTTPTSGLQVGWNQSNGNQEVDFFNPTLLSNTASGGFNFYQMIGNVAVTPVLRIQGNGTIIAANFMTTVSGSNTVGMVTAGTFNGTVITTAGLQSYSNSTVFLAGGNTVVLPTGMKTVTQANSDNTTNVATTAYVQNQFPTTTVGTYNAVVVNSKGIITSGTYSAWGGGTLFATGDVSGTSSGNTIALTLVNSITGGTFTQLVVNNKGQVTYGQNPSISYSGDVSGTATLGSNPTLTLATIGSGGTSWNTINVDAKGRVTTGSTIAYLTTNQSITLSGDATGTGSTSISLTLASVGSAGTWTQVQTDGKGRVTSGQNPNISYSGDVSGTATMGTNVTLNLANNNSAGLGTYTCLTVNAKGIVTYATQMIASGDATGTVSAGTLPLTLATVNSNVGSFGGATVVPAITVNAKGLITGVTGTNIAYPVTSVGGSTGVVTGGTFSTIVAHTGQVTAVTQPSSDNTTNVATTAFVKSTAGNYMPIAGGTFTGSVAISSGNTLTVNGAVFALSTINALNQVAATGGLYNLSPTANTINYTQVNVYDGNTGGYYINNAGGVNRWSFITSAAVGSQATNANTGADLTFTAWTGAGSPPATATNVLTLYRGNAVAAFSNTITTITQPLTDATSNVATTAFVKSANATQISRYVTGTIGTSSGTYTITPSNAVPVSPFTGWGTLWTASITPTSTSSKIRIAFNISFSVSIARTMLFLITRGTTVIGMAGQYGATTLQMFSHSMDVIDSPATTSTTTYTCYYAGQVTAGTVYWNQQGGSTAYTYGSAMTSSYSLQDV